MKKTFLYMSVLTLLLLLVTVAYSSNTDVYTTQIKMGDFYFNPETIYLSPGQYVKLEFINEGKLEHEFMVGRIVTTEGKEEKQEISISKHKHPEGMHEKHEEKHEPGEDKQIRNNVTHVHTASFINQFFEGIDVEHSVERAKFMEVPGHGTMLMLQPGGNATLSFKVPDNRKGEWETACFVPGHYEAKMKGKLIIY